MTMPSPTVFVVDDHAAVREALGEMLSVFGYAVKTYELADGFLRALDRRSAGCVVADVRMPGTDGIGLVRELVRRNVALPVILISGHADVPMAVTAIKAGAEDFIEKPIDDTQLVAAINRALARRSRTAGLHKSQGGSRRQVCAPDATAGRNLRSRGGGFHQSRHLRPAEPQRADGRKLSRRGHGKDAGRERRRVGAAGDPPRHA